MSRDTKEIEREMSAERRASTRLEKMILIPLKTKL